MKRCGNCKFWLTQWCKYRATPSGLERGAFAAFCSKWKPREDAPNTCGSCRWLNGKKCVHPAENLPTRIPRSRACCLYEPTSNN